MRTIPAHHMVERSNEMVLICASFAGCDALSYLYDNIKAGHRYDCHSVKVRSAEALRVQSGEGRAARLWTRSVILCKSILIVLCGMKNILRTLLHRRA